MSLTNQFEVRDFAMEDREFFLASCVTFYDSPAVAEPVPVSNFERTFEICLQGSPFVQGVIFWVNNQRAGYGLLSFTYSNEVGGLSILLEEVFILPEFQGQGIATQLFSILEEQFISSGKAKRLRLEVTSENQGAVALYERMGFHPLPYIQMIKDFT